VSREVHAGICESRRVRLLRPLDGLNIHFFTADELRDVIGTSFAEVVPLRSHSTPRTSPGHGQWSQWEAIWQQRAPRR
jgi:hypothetical protein